MKDSGKRVVIERVTPCVENGLYPAKGIAGEKVTVTADIFADGHDVVHAVLRYGPASSSGRTEIPMKDYPNDYWEGSFTPLTAGEYKFNIVAWVDRFGTWRRDLEKRVAAGQTDLDTELLIGTELVRNTAEKAADADARRLERYAEIIGSVEVPLAERTGLAAGTELFNLMNAYPERKHAVTCPQEFTVLVEHEKALFSTWYEMFPRSSWSEEEPRGTFKTCEDRLPLIAEMGFDILYLPPIHPIGITSRKGKNNALTAGENDPGTPWAIGSADGGHLDIDPQLGTLEDFRHLVQAARGYGIDVALDIALQCSPDHPWVREHPEWFSWRPDGTVQYAENPPKKYQDIYPLNFDTADSKGLWHAIRDIMFFWADQGIRFFRIDNPHTKPFVFWEWMLKEMRDNYPGTVFLAEAFTRPKIMYRLAKLGFTQSYTYFTWRNTKAELTEYLTELTRTEVKDFFRPSFWPNTPDILHAYLQTGNRAAFIARLALAATLSPSYGIYGPAFELMEHIPREPGSEEYHNSEKYEIKHWNVRRPDSLKDIIAVINLVRRENRALQSNQNLWFNATGSDMLICYSKHLDDLSNIILVVVNLDPQTAHEGKINVPLAAWGFDAGLRYQAHDLLDGNRYTWQGEWNWVRLDPSVCPVHIFRIEPIGSQTRGVNR